MQATHVQQRPAGQQLLQLLPNPCQAQAAAVEVQMGQARGSSQPCRQRRLRVGCGKALVISQLSTLVCTVIQASVH